MRRGVAHEMTEYKARSMFSIKHAAETMRTPEATCERSKTCLISSVPQTMARPRQKLAGDGSSVAALNLTFSTLTSGLSPGSCRRRSRQAEACRRESENERPQSTGSKPYPRLFFFGITNMIGVDSCVFLIFTTRVK